MRQSLSELTISSFLSAWVAGCFQYIFSSTENNVELLSETGHAAIHAGIINGVLFACYKLFFYFSNQEQAPDRPAGHIGGATLCALIFISAACASITTNIEKQDALTPPVLIIIIGAMTLLLLPHCDTEEPAEIQSEILAFDELAEAPGSAV